MSFTSKSLTATIHLGTGQFGDTGFDTIKVTGLRMNAAITNAGSPALGNCQLAIFGLQPSIVKELSVISPGAMTVRNNTLVLEASTDSNTIHTAFQGTLLDGQADYSSSPETCLILTAVAGMFYKLKPAPTNTFSGPKDVAQMLSNIASAMGLGFENKSDIHIQLSNPYYYGSAFDQAAKIVQDAGIEWNACTDGGVLAGYPRRSTSGGLAVKTAYSPDLKIGGQVQIESAINVANGSFNIYDITHELDSLTPGGRWFTSFNAIPQSGFGSS